VIPRDDHGLPAASAYPSFGDMQAHYRANMTSEVTWNQSVDVSGAMAPLKLQLLLYVNSRPTII
jgi:hypothetical protein